MKKITLKLDHQLLENVRTTFKARRPHRKADYFSEIVREILYNYIETPITGSLDAN